MPNVFTFAAGNLSKLLRLPLYALGRPAQWFTPRRREEWVFGSGAGVAQGAWELWQEVARREPEARMTWLVANEAQAEQATDAGIDWEHAQSWRGFVRTLRAGTAVVTHGLGDVNRYASGGSFLVQLWHGIPLKRIHLDSPATFALGDRLPAAAGALLRRAYLASTRAISLFPVPSALVGERIASAFGLDPARIAVTGDPRDEALVRGDAAARRAAARRILRGAGVLSRSDAGRRLVFFAPTWRDGEEDPSVPTPTERAALEELAEELDLLVLVRPHPLGVGAYRAAIAGSERLRMVDADDVQDVNEILSAMDVLVTDYSSVALDYSLGGGRIVWFAPDRADYEASRGLYEDYDLTTGGHVASWGEVVGLLREVLEDRAASDAALEATRRLRERFFDVTEPGAPARVYEEILRRRDGRVAAGPSADATTAGVVGQSVFFESFYGRLAGDNPAGIDAALARLRPGTVRYWSVESGDVPVPEGAVAVVQGTAAWDAARRAATAFVVNDWLRAPVPRPREQRVLQTWHGTPLKRLALGRPRVGLRTRLAVLRQSRRWDALLSQNPYCGRALARDYAYRGPVWDTGYPRNDAFGGDRAAARSAARAALGLDERAKVALYAPTWRDDARIVLDGAGLSAAATELGEEWVLLVRAHSRVTEGFGVADGVRDVSSEPDLARLLLAADVLVTDYSSVMFDAASLEIPLVFFVPDLELYRDEQRGFGLDLEALAPGPLVRSLQDMVAAVRRAGDGIEPAFAERTRAWRERFTPWDDGDSGDRVVRRMIAEGFIE